MAAIAQAPAIVLSSYATGRGGGDGADVSIRSFDQLWITSSTSRRCQRGVQWQIPTHGECRGDGLVRWLAVVEECGDKGIGGFMNELGIGVIVRNPNGPLVVCIVKNYPSRTAETRRLPNGPARGLGISI